MQLPRTRSRCAIGALFALTLALTAAPRANAQSDAPAVQPPVAAAAAHPWEQAQAVLTATENDYRQNGLQSVANHLSDIEQALTDGDKAFARTEPGDGPIVVLTDGIAESIIAMGAAGKIAEPTKRQVVAVHSPYPMLGLYLGSYYNEVGRHDDAVRVLNRTIKLSAIPDMRLGEHLPYLVSEKGAAFSALRRWDDALADYDDGLKIATMADEARARLYRGRGYALTELGRLDEAEQAYDDSLKLAPDNPLALNELKYIAQLRAGGPKAPPGQLSLPAPANPQ